MGYMGFGMRKEVYTRKPKKAFEKVKKVYGKELDFPASNKSKKRNKATEDPVSFVPHPYQPFHERPVYRVLRALVIAAAIGVALWFIYLDQDYQRHKRQQFEATQFRAYYEQHLSSYDFVFRFLHDRSDKIVDVDKNYGNEAFYLRIVSPDFTDDRYDHSEHALFEGRILSQKVPNEDELIDGKLTIYREGFLPKVYPSNWSYSLRNITADQVPPSVLAYLETHAKTFSAFFHALSAIDRPVYIKGDSIYTYWSHESYGQYSLVYAEKPLASFSEKTRSYEDRTIVGALTNHVYWVRRDRVRRKT